MDDKVESLHESFLKELERATDLLIVYEQLPNNIGIFGATIIKNTISKAHKALSEDNVIEMLKVYEELKSLE